MSKQKQTPTQPEQAVATVQASPVLVMVAGTAPAFKGARAAWYDSVQAAASKGMTVAEWQAACLANPPSVPQRGKLAGQVEPPSGWLRWFTRNGYVTLQPSK